MQIKTAVLGADDPEMRAIEAVLVAAGLTAHDIHYAASGTAPRRAGPGDAYGASHMLVESASGRECVRIYSSAQAGCLWVECTPDDGLPALRADHHREGDPGFGRPPAEFWQASSLGQVCGMIVGGACGVQAADAAVADGLALGDTRRELAFIAAADHCLAAALQGQCPGVDPDALLDWRLTASGSPHTSEPDGQGGRRRVPPEIVRERALLARYMLAPGYSLDACRLVEGVGLVTIGETIAVDLRAFGSATVGLPLADVACRLGLAYVLRVREGWPERGHGGREKLVLGGCGEGSVPGVVPMAAWEAWCRGQGCAGEVYGDPARGYAGCYLAPREAQS